jgi:hypothetical protein
MPERIDVERGLIHIRGGKGRKMVGGHLREKRISSTGMYMRSTSDIPPNWDDIRSIVDIRSYMKLPEWKERAE